MVGKTAPSGEDDGAAQLLRTLVDVFRPSADVDESLAASLRLASALARHLVSSGRVQASESLEERLALLCLGVVLGHSAPGLVPAVAGAAEALTPRVREVALLVADGLRDREIAERLHLSPRTVHRHVATALRVTGTRHRVELATAVAGQRST